jgi:hypothetical protein
MKKLNDLIKDGKVSNSTKFMLVDVLEMRENNWIPMKRRSLPITTLDQVTIQLCNLLSH